MKKIKIVSFWGIPLSKLKQKEDLVNPDVDNPFYYVFKELEKRYIILEDTSKEVPDFVFHFNFVIEEIYKYRNSINIFFAFEPEIVEKNHSKENIKEYLKYYDYIMIWNEDIVDNQFFYKINYMYHFKKIESKIKDFEKLKLLVNFSGNKKSSNPKELYSERLKTIEYYEEKKEEFEFYGRNWEKENYKNYKGTVEKKGLIYDRFKFALCLENMKENGYITEKIFDCFTLGIVPIYSGGNEKYIPKNCYIDYFDFKSQEELYIYLKKMSKEEWENYINNDKKWLASNKKNYFQEEFFVEQINNILKRPKRIDNNKFIVNKKIESLFYFKKNMRKLRKKIKKYLKGLIK